MSAPDTRKVTLTSGLRLEVAELGRRGPSFLFLHGYTDSWRSFERVLPLLPDGVHALVPSQRGHGGSDRPDGDQGPAQLAADAAALLDAVGVDRATVIGHSMGSLVAQALALAHPERVEHLVLVGAAGCFDSPGLRELERALAELDDPLPPAFVREFQESTVHCPVPEGFLDMAVRESLRMPARVWKRTLADLLAFDARPALARLGMPALLLWGDRDAVVPRPAAEQLARGLPRATFSVLEETGHAPHWEQPERFVDALLPFVRAVAPAVPAGTRAPR